MSTTTPPQLPKNLDTRKPGIYVMLSGDWLKNQKVSPHEVANLRSLERLYELRRANFISKPTDYNKALLLQLQYKIFYIKSGL